MAQGQRGIVKSSTNKKGSRNNTTDGLKTRKRRAQSTIDGRCRKVGGGGIKVLLARKSATKSLPMADCFRPKAESSKFY